MLKVFSSQKHLKDKLLDKKIEGVWKNLYEGIAHYTTRIQFKSGVLYVWLSSSPLRHELSFNKAKIINQVNTALKEELIKQLELR
ncbi:MAG: DUF721 domain-containing protein [Saprospiraceae bacterium]|nr:DUF721 domain-containing protein [Saprospiraceae bacterium]